MTKQYTLERTLPGGVVKTWPMLMTAREAGVVAAMCLYDNGRATKADAQRISPKVEASQGQPVEAFGYTFRLIP